MESHGELRRSRARLIELSARNGVTPDADEQWRHLFAARHIATASPLESSRAHTHTEEDMASFDIRSQHVVGEEEKWRGRWLLTKEVVYVDAGGVQRRWECLARTTHSQAECDGTHTASYIDYARTHIRAYTLHAKSSID